MFKKIIIIIIVIAVLALASIPMWTTKMAEEAFKNPSVPISSAAVQKAVKLKMYMYMYSDARKYAEKAIILFPESEYLHYFIYSAALCADKENNPDAAIYWYDRFIELFPNHDWTQQARNNRNKLKAMQE